MAYRKIAMDKKAEAVKRVFRGEMVTAVAEDMGIDRNSLSSWVRRALNAIHSNLERKKREKKPGRERTRSGSVAQLTKLKEKIARQEKKIAEMRDSLRSSVEAPVPERCRACGCMRFYKGGIGRMHLERLLGKKISGANQIIPVQKFTCANCGSSTHLDGPPALFHWVTESYRGVERGRICAGRKQGRRARD
jgi:transposase-like protein